MTRAAFRIIVWREDDPSARDRADAAARITRATGQRDIAAGQNFKILSSHPILNFETVGRGRVLIIGEASGDRLTPVSDHEPAPALHVADPVSAAHEMLATIWGGYTAFFVDIDGVALLADPSGALPFDTIEERGVVIATDDLTPKLCRAIGHVPTIDWRSLVTTLIAPATAVHLSHLVGVRPSVPGRLYPLGGTDPDMTIWSPAELARGLSAHPGASIRDAVDRSTAALGRRASAIQLSGGLDSSIVLASLCGAGEIPTSITFATQAAGGDERCYARTIAEHCGSPLIACDADRLPSYASLFQHAPGAHPFIYGLDDVFEEAVTSTARNAGCDRLLTGQGGDAAFFQPATALVAVDRARALGFGPRALEALVDDARRARSSIWHQLLPAIADRFRPATVPTERVAERLLTPKARALLGRQIPLHPWLDGADELSPGKAMHIVMLANSQIFHARRPDPQALALRHPLLTQPVLEAVLPIPTYILAFGSNDRGLARATFADRLPATIVERHVKGDAADHYSRGTLKSLPFLREMLLDGVLVREGLVDADALATVLTREHLFYSLDYRALVMHATCEAWARYWTTA